MMAIHRNPSKEEDRVLSHPGEIVRDYMEPDELIQKEPNNRMNSSQNRLN